MFSNSLAIPNLKNIHCEYYGQEVEIDNTKVLTKISGVISLKQLINPHINFEERIIYSSNRPPLNFFTKLYVPEGLKNITGDLFAIVDDVEELEQSTCILSEKGMDFLMGNQIIKFINYLDNNDIVKFPESMFFTSINDFKDFNTKQERCENWGGIYPSIGNKYFVKSIVDTKSESMTFGLMSLGHGLLWPDYDVGVSDVSEKNINGTGYQFKTDRKFRPLNFCSNESAVDYCIKNNLIAYYIDFLNGGKMRVLCKYTVEINEKLRNKYRYRSLYI